MLMAMASAAVIGSGPNGLAAAITVAAAGVETTVFERNARIGGGCSTGETTLLGFRHDLGSSVYPMGLASEFFRSLPVRFPFIQPEAPCAHPLDGGGAVMLERSIGSTLEGLNRVDREAYRSLLGTISEHFVALAEDLLEPMPHVPRHPLLMAGFGPWALLPAAALAKFRFQGPRARALFAGMAAHSVLSLEAASSAAVGLVLMAAGHSVGWPIVRGGAQTIADGLAEHLRSLGGRIETGAEVTALDRKFDVTLADVTPRQLLRIAGGSLPEDYRRQLEEFRYGAGAFKIDYALSEPIPWTAPECGRAATVHLCGSFEEIVASERTFLSEKPFVLLVQPSLFDTTRAPEGKHTAWAYCHVPNGSGVDRLGDIERQIERFAPGFAECVLARSVMGPTALEAWNANLVGGDFSGGAMNLAQLAFRPTRSLYRTPVAGLYLCGASTPPGGGVHGMAGYHAGRAAQKYLGLRA
jgi:phytoene dehydrogenase-like protein